MAAVSFDSLLTRNVPKRTTELFSEVFRWPANSSYSNSLYTNKTDDCET